MITQLEDPNFHSIRNVLEHRGIPYFLLNISEGRQPSDITHRLSSQACSSVLTDDFGVEVHPELVKGVWCRGYSFHKHAPPPPGSVHNFIRHEEIYALEYFFYLLRAARWVNPIESTLVTRRAVANRLVQAELAAKVGLNVPRQIASNSYSELLEFVNEHGDLGAVTKQLSQGTPSESGPALVLTMEVSQADIDRCCKSSGCPVLIQEAVPKDHELRVVVVGNRVFSAAVDPFSEGKMLVDSRESAKNNITYYRARLSDDESQKLIDLNRLLGLNYSSIDLIRQPDGQLVFLEANPAGQWGFVESFTGYPITEAIVSEMYDYE